MVMVKYLDLKEFCETGYLHELNRQFLHPLGLALAVRQDDDGSMSLDGILDFRDDPEGAIFGEGVVSEEKIENIRNIATARRVARMEALGYWIQEPAVPTTEKHDGVGRLTTKTDLLLASLREARNRLREGQR